MTTPISDIARRAHDPRSLRHPAHRGAPPGRAHPPRHRGLDRRRPSSPRACARVTGTAPVLLVDAYPGADVPALTTAVPRRPAGLDRRRASRPPPAPVAEVEAADRPEPHRRPRLRGDEPLHPDRLLRRAAKLDALAGGITQSPTVVIGWGSALLAPRLDGAAATVLVDMARWEIRCASARAPRTGAPRTPRKTTCASTSAASSSSGAFADRPQAQPVRHGRLRARRNAIDAGRTASGLARSRHDHRKRVPTGPEGCGTPAVPRRAVLRPRSLGRPVDEEPHRPRPLEGPTTRGASTACPRRTRCCWRERAA